jgi:hypothetical protein
MTGAKPPQLSPLWADLASVIVGRINSARTAPVQPPEVEKKTKPDKQAGFLGRRVK